MATSSCDTVAEVEAVDAAERAHHKRRAAVAAETVRVRFSSEAGRVWGHATRGRLVRDFTWRFNWFGDMWPGAVREERTMALKRWGWRFAVLASMFWSSP